MLLDPKFLAEAIVESALDKQAQDVLLIDLRSISSLADYFVVVSGTVDVHVKAIVDNIQRELRDLEEPVHALRVEGYSNLFWVLLDYGDVVVHVFHPEAREYYKLEKLWGDAPVKLYSEETYGN